MKDKTKQDKTAHINEIDERGNDMIYQSEIFLTFPSVNL